MRAHVHDEGGVAKLLSLTSLGAVGGEERRLLLYLGLGWSNRSNAGTHDDVDDDGDDCPLPRSRFRDGSGLRRGGYVRQVSYFALAM